MTPKKILFCADFSENSKPACRLAIDYAKAFGASLVLFHVIDPGALRYPRFEDLVPLEDTLKAMGKACDRDLENMRQEVEKELPSVTTFSLNGAAAQKIVNFATEQKMDLIVMGTHGWTGLNRIVLGSVAENVARRSPCPIVIVRSFPADS